MRMAAFSRADEGQALVIVALAMVALMGALALTLDWGYAYVQHRGLQNAVDGATLAAGRHVASTFKLVSGTPVFDATLEDVCDDVATRTAGLPGLTEISFFSDPDNPGAWTTVATSDCAAGSGVAVPNDTVFVRVRSIRTFRSVVQQTVTIAASARARLSGSAGCDNIDCTALRPLELPSGTPGQGISGYTTGPNVAIWPLVLHLNLADFQGSPCGQYCEALTGPGLKTLWPRDLYGPAGQFRGLVTYTHFSPREHDDGSDSIHQFSTESDYTGTTELSIRQAHDHDDGAIYPPARMPNADPAACGGASAWDTLGREALSDAASCDLPNWFAYGFRGSIGASTDWSTSFNGLPGNGVDRPEPLAPSRASCNRSVYLPRPSCTSPSNQIGDWIETVPGNLTPLMAQQMRDFVARYGRLVPNSSTPVSASPGAPLLGKAVVVFVPLWDCAEHFDPTAGGGDPDRWTLITPGGGDCSQLASGSGPVDRVHIVSAVPFTFYEGLITTSPVSVQGYWGDVFGDAGVCSADPLAAACDLNQIMNSAFLVPDE
jgi:hypothetical protein